MYKLKWEFPIKNGKLIVSLRPPQYGIPPWAFISSTSDPINLSEVTKTALYL
jgi:hypothetical protein